MNTIEQLATFQSSRDKRNAYRIKIRRQTNSQLFRQRRAEFFLLNNQQPILLQCPDDPIILYQKSLVNNGLLQYVKDRNLLQIIQINWNKYNQHFMVCILANILLDNISLDQKQQIFRMVQHRSIQDMNHKFKFQIMSMFINSLFTNFQSFDQDYQTRIQQRFLPFIFNTLNSRIQFKTNLVNNQHGIDIDLLNSIHLMFRKVSQPMDRYYRFLKNFEVLENLLKYHWLIIQAHESLSFYQEICLNIFKEMIFIQYNIGKIMEKFGGKILNLLKHYLFKKQQNSAGILTALEILTWIIQSQSGNQILADPILRQMFLKKILRVPSKCIKILHFVCQRNLEQIQVYIPQILSAIKHNLAYEDKNIVALSLATLYQILGSRHAEKYLNEWKNIGGWNALDELEAQQNNQDILNLIAQIWNQIYDLFDEK